MVYEDRTAVYERRANVVEPMDALNGLVPPNGDTPAPMTFIIQTGSR